MQYFRTSGAIKSVYKLWRILDAEAMLLVLVKLPAYGDRGVRLGTGLTISVAVEVGVGWVVGVLVGVITTVGVMAGVVVTNSVGVTESVAVMGGVTGIVEVIGRVGVRMGCWAMNGARDGESSSSNSHKPRMVKMTIPIMPLNKGKVRCISVSLA